MAAPQYQTVAASLETVMLNKMFVLGFFAVRKGEPWPSNFDVLSEVQQCRYERGRHFAAACPSVQKLATASGLHAPAVRAWREASAAGEVI